MKRERYAFRDKSGLRGYCEWAKDGEVVLFYSQDTEHLAIPKEAIPTLIEFLGACQFLNKNKGQIETFKP